MMRGTDHSIDVLDNAARGSGYMDFPDIGARWSYAELWSEARRAAAWLARLTGGGRVGTILVNAPDAVITAFGTWRAGLDLVSIPLPGRGMAFDAYQQHVQKLCAATGVEVLVVDEAMCDAFAGLGLRVEAAQKRSSTIPSDAGLAGTPRVIQFTSGSTGTPKPAVVTLASLLANVDAIVQVMDPRPGDSMCSWLPISHDMGLVSILLGGIVCNAPEITGSFRCTMLRPESFIRRPQSWLETCSETGASISGAPPFALERAARALRRSSQLDLSRLRALVVAANPIRARDLRTFAEAAGPHGLRSTAFCPGYGLAEAAASVSLTPPDAAFRSVSVDPLELVDGNWVETDDGRGREIVAVGPPMPTVDVEIAGDTAVGEILVRGPSIFQGYLTDPESGQVERGDAVATGDLGYLDERGQLFCLGRFGDVIKVGPRRVSALDIESVVDGQPGLRPDYSVAFADTSGRYVVVVEQPANYDQPLEALAGTLRAELVQAVGIAPSELIAIAPGSLPKTSSGKLQRRQVEGAYYAETLQVEQRIKIAN